MAVAALNVADAKKVRFQVDMTGRTVSANGVHVAGNFQKAAGASDNWKPNETRMLNTGTGNIYWVVVDIPAKARYEFKFINDNNWGAGEEQIPAISQVGSAANGGNNSNRWIYIDSLANDTTVLPAILFSGAAPRSKSALRFAVDLQKETAVSANGIYIAGNFQGSNGATGDWKPNETRMSNLFTNNKVYEYIAYVDTTAGVEWKYLNGNDWPFNENVPSACQKGGGNQNRFYQATGTSMALAKVCFAACAACPTAPTPKYTLRFQVDMSNSDCDGGFDSVTVAGAGARLTAFGAGLKLAEIGTSKIFALSVDSLDSGEVNFKFRAHKNGNTGWEGGDNRLYALTKNDTLPLTCFGSRVVGNCPPKPAPSNITFRVDMTKAAVTPDRIYVMGTFQTPNWQAGAIRMKPVTGYPGLFEATVNNVCPGSFQFKFVNGDSSVASNEEQFKDTADRGCVVGNGIGGFNRVYTRTSTAPVMMTYYYDSCVTSALSVKESSLNANDFKLYPNPAESYTTVEFNDQAVSHSVYVMDITGKVIQSYISESNKLVIPTAELHTGIYLIKATNTRNESITSKLIVR